MALALSAGQAVGLLVACFCSTVVVSKILEQALTLGPLPAAWALAATTALGFLMPAALFAQAADVRLALGLPRTPRWVAWTVGAALLAPAFVLLQHGIAFALAHWGAPRLLLDGGHAPPMTPAMFAAQWLALALVPGVCEELVFRGLIQPALALRLGSLRGLLATAVLFEICHVEPQNALAGLPLALLLGGLAARAHSLAPGMALHVAYNSAVLALIYRGQDIVRDAWLAPWAALSGLVGVLVLLHALRASG
jgi:membrane protease YdiL (CAAX protease family)